MDIRDLIVEISEKIGLIATAGLLTVLVPPLRNRLLGVGRPRDALVAGLFGLTVAMWGGRMGVLWLGYNTHLLAIGVLIAGFLGGARTGAVIGLLAGLFYLTRVDPETGFLPVVVSTTNGLLAGVLVERVPRVFQGFRTLPTSVAIQFAAGVLVTPYLVYSGELGRYLSALPAVTTQILGGSAGATLFAVTARVVLAREENAVALIKAQAAADTMALEALRRRLEPHFLFNALNTIRATIRIDPAQARDLVSHLADLYRYLLNHPDDAPLAKEVEHACAYLAIERVRLGEGRLEVETEVAPEVRNVRVPALLLQPLVENAVKHGVAAHAGRGKVRVVARRDEEGLVIDVTDASSGRSLERGASGSGIALRTLRERLSRSFGNEASLVLTPTETGMNARVRLPWLGAHSPIEGGGHERSAA